MLRDQRGSVTAEYAVTLPVVASMLVLSVGVIGLAAHQLRLSAAAADLARAEARGENATTNTLGYPVTVYREEIGQAHCVTLTASPAKGALSVVNISARSCALRSDS